MVVERWIDDVNLPQVRVPSVREAMGPMSAIVFGRPAERLLMVGVTGTNGKTTSSWLLESILRTAGRHPGVIGTTGARAAGEPLQLERTTPEAPDLQRLLWQMVELGIDSVVMEVSSHALDQHRVGGVKFERALFTNLSQDHLDYHPDMEEYFSAKARLFTPQYAEQGIVGIDDDWGKRLAKEAAIGVLTFGIEEPADIRATEVRSDPSGSSFEIEGRAVRSPLLGAFNVLNCVGALAVARTLGIEPASAIDGIQNVEGVPGRVERVDQGQDFLLMVDYAHTPDSIDNVLRASRPLTRGRLIVVFGCGGDRDRTKRPEMGRAATSLADLTVITSDNPRSEDPGSIIAQIEPGARAGGGLYAIEPDRRAAIALAIREAHPGDVVVIAGKGHETGQEFADRTIPFDDRVVAAEELRSAGAGG